MTILNQQSQEQLLRKLQQIQDPLHYPHLGHVSITKRSPQSPRGTWRCPGRSSTSPTPSICLVIVFYWTMLVCQHHMWRHWWRHVFKCQPPLRMRQPVLGRVELHGHRSACPASARVRSVDILDVVGVCVCCLRAVWGRTDGLRHDRLGPAVEDCRRYCSRRSGNCVMCREKVTHVA